MKTRITKNGISIIKILGGRSNVFLLKYNSHCLLIDTGVSWNRKKLKSRLKSLDINCIDLLILTHTHFDHVANARLIKEKYGAKVLVHRSEATNIKIGFTELPQGTNWFTHFLIHRVSPKLKQLFKFTPCTCDILVDSQFDLKPFGFDAYILHTPGHSEGSSSIIVDNEIAIVGDAMFGVFPWSVFPPFANNTKEMVNSWGKLLKTGCNTFLPAHGWACNRRLLEKNYFKYIYSPLI